VLGDVGQPDLIRLLGVELTTHQVIVHRRAWRLARPPSKPLHGGGEHALERTQPLDAVLRRPVASGLELISDEPVAELGVVTVDVEDGVEQVRVVPVALRDRGGEPLVEPLGGEAQHPAGHRDGDAVVGEVTDQRVGHFGAASLAK
jgi:hypothetical protein